jgi:hypothetical protein
MCFMQEIMRIRRMAGLNNGKNYSGWWHGNLLVAALVLLQ